MTLNKRDGFTLIEMTIAMFMLSITMAAFYSVYRMQTRSLKGQDNRLEAQQTARTALDFMVREIRNTGYNPNEETNGDDCADWGNAGTPGVIEATATTFHFSYDANKDGTCSGGGTLDENIKYSFANSDITREVDGGAAEELTDGNATGLTLAYFDQAGNPLTAVPLSAADRDKIQRVSITVTIDSKNMDDQFGGALSATMTTNVDLRNPSTPWETVGKK